MNTIINEMKEVLVNNNVTSINKGIESINDYLKGFEFHECKVEWSSMNRDEKRSFVKKLMNTEVNDEFTNEEIEVQQDDEIIENNENDDDLNVTNENTDEPVEEENVTECQRLLEEEKNELLVQREELLKQLQSLNDRLKELGHTTDVSTETKSKVQIVKDYFEQNPNSTRKEFMEHFVDLGSKAMLSTYFQSYRPK